MTAHVVQPDTLEMPRITRSTAALDRPARKPVGSVRGTFRPMRRSALRRLADRLLPGRS